MFVIKDSMITATLFTLKLFKLHIESIRRTLPVERIFHEYFENLTDTKLHVREFWKRIGECVDIEIARVIKQSTVRYAVKP